MDPLDVTFHHSTIKRRSLNGAAVTLVAQSLKFAFQFGSILVLARLLDPAQFGLVALTAPLLGFLKTFNDLGLGQAIVQRPDLTRPQLSALFWINLCIGAALTAITALIAPLAGWLYSEPRMVGIILALAPLLTIYAVAVAPAALLNRQMRFNALAIVEIGSVAAAAVTGLLSAWLGCGFWSLVYMQIANSGMWLLLCWALAGWRPSWPARVGGIGALLRFGSNITGSNLATYFATSADNILVGLVNGKVALGLYDRSYSLVVQPLSQIMAPVGRIAVPMLSRLVATPDHYRRAYLLMLQVGMLISIPGLLVNIFEAEPLIRLLLGPDWSQAAPVFSWICVGGLATAFNSSAFWLFTSQDRTRELASFAAINAALSVASFAIGVVWGIVGVAVCSATCFALIQTPLIIWAATRTGAVSLRTVARVGLAFGAAATASTLVLDTLQLGQFGVVGLAASVALSYSAFVAALFCLPDGRRFLREMAALGGGFYRDKLAKSAPRESQPAISTVVGPSLF